jgi:transcription elongation GreA/GreB family factor
MEIVFANQVRNWKGFVNKKSLIDHLRASLEEVLEIQKESERATREAATHEESKPENQYDTRALEASYLAGAQSKRIIEMEELLIVYKHTPLKSFTENDPIANTALVEVEFRGRTNFLFLMPKGGGAHIMYENKKIQVITPSSPLGAALLGLKVGDVALVENGGQALEYEVLSIQ